MTQPSIDGTVSGNIGNNNSSKVLSLTTTAAGLIIVQVACEQNSNAICNRVATAVSDTASLTWKRRFQVVMKTSGDLHRTNEVWYAVSAGAHSGLNITVTIDAGVDSGVVNICGVKNCTGWDPNLQLPQLSTDTEVATYNTDNADSLVMAFEVSSNGGSAPAGGGGGPATFTLVTNARDGSGFGFAGGAIYSATNTSIISAGTVTGVATYGTVVDVLTNDTATPYAAPTLDGSNWVEFAVNTNSQAVNLTTTAAGEIVALIMSESNSSGGVTSTVSSVTATGLTFTRRGGYTGHGSSGSGTQINIEEWAAPSSGAVSAKAITVTLNGAGGSCDAAAVLVMGIAGTTGPFDADGSVPATAANDNVTGITTDSTHDLLVWLSGSVSNGGYSGLPSGFSELAAVGQAAGFTGTGFRVGIKRINATLASATISAGSAGTNVANLVDALTAGGSAAPTPIPMDSRRNRTYLRR